MPETDPPPEGPNQGGPNQGGPNQGGPNQGGPIQVGPIQVGPSPAAPAEPPAAQPPAAPAVAPQTVLQKDLLRKAELEAALIAAPQDGRVRAAYFEELIRFASVRTGLSHAVLPELGHPLMLRCGTADLLAFLRAFRDRAYDFAIRATPERILILGAYVGFSAVLMAHRFPRADILCVEPSAA
jgi:hypothetical protein